mmetsp:Transcript_96/g.206  ORF Transcript_96/g.206 Transcript_96/m.206 type:complete len:102 (+) Transcript_96:441-746(+)
MGLPMNIEKSSKIHGRYGALKGNKPRKPILTCAFSGDRPQIYTIIKDKGCPRNLILRNVTTVVANKVIMDAPNANMKNKSAARPRNSPSSSNRQYLITKYI